MYATKSAFFKSNGDLYQNPELYDLVVNKPTQESAFFLHQIHSIGHDVLELACGTGRMIFSLLEQDPMLNCTGLDLSSSMLVIARQKALLLGHNAVFHHGNMENFDIDRQFDVIFIAASGISYLHTDTQILNCFHTVKKTLKPHGRFILSIFNPSIDVISRTPDNRYDIKLFVNPENNKEILVEQSSNYNPITKVNHATHFYSYADQKDFFSHPVHLRMLFPQDVPPLLEHAGFKVVDLYGDHLGSKFTAHSKWHIVVCSI